MFNLPLSCFPWTRNRTGGNVTSRYRPANGECAAEARGSASRRRGNAIAISGTSSEELRLQLDPWS